MRCETSAGKSCAAQPKPAKNENNRSVRLHKVTRNRLNIEDEREIISQAAQSDRRATRWTTI